MWPRVAGTARTVFEIFKGAVQGYGEDRANRMAAAVSYRTMFTLAPLLLIAVYGLGLVVGDDAAARDQILVEVERVAGESVGRALETFLDSVARSGDTAGVIGFVLLVWTGSSLFLELQQDLNDIFTMPTEKVSGLLRVVRQRLIGFAWSLGIGLILVALWLLNAVWRYIGGLFGEDFGPAHRLIGVLAPLLSLLLLPVVFAVAFQSLTRHKLRWRALWLGSVFTSLVFLLASYGAGLYFQYTAQDAAGIAGSIFVILLLAYVLAAVLFFGAEVTKALERYWLTGSALPSPVVAPSAVVSQPPPPAPTSALVAFLAGLWIGRRRKP